jgi:hypothetical protein
VQGLSQPPSKLAIENGWWSFDYLQARFGEVGTHFGIKPERENACHSVFAAISLARGLSPVKSERKTTLVNVGSLSSDGGADFDVWRGLKEDYEDSR